MATPTSTPLPDPISTFFGGSHLVQQGKPFQPGSELAHSPTLLESLQRNLEPFSMPAAFPYVLGPSQAKFPSIQITFVTTLPWESMIASAKTQNEILLLLQESGFKHTADRLRYLQNLSRDDPEEPSIVIDSMRALVCFLMTEQSLPDPEIGISPNGLAQIEWRIPPDGILVMEFLPTSLIRFAAVSASTKNSDIRLRVNGTLPKGEVRDAIRSFTSSIEQPQ